MHGDPYLTPPEIARRWRVSAGRVRSEIEAGRLQALDLSAGTKQPRYRISSEALRRYEQARAAKPRPAAAKKKPKPDQVVEFV